MTWVLLLSAAVLEAVWAIALKRSHGLTELPATIVFLVALAASSAMLAAARCQKRC